MKKKNPLLIISISFISVSIIIIFYSLYLIIGSNIRSDEMNAEWEALLASQSSVSSMSNVSSSEELSSPEISNTNSESNNQTSNTNSSSSQSKPSTSTYKRELFGQIIFPTIKNRKVTIVNGTTKADLRGAAGRATYSKKPGEIGNCIVFGHRDGVFRGFGNLKIDDIITFKTISNEYTYKITNMQVTDPGNFIISKIYKDKSVLTLVTCYPFNYVGAAPFRYVVIAELVK